MMRICFGKDLDLEDIFAFSAGRNRRRRDFGSDTVK
jgi:hypothetical protein